jgi:Sulfotransferase domain
VTEPGMLPNFLIVGAMRSGTSSLARYLRAHPDVCMATQKEVRYFDRNFERGVDWYRAHFPCSQLNPAVGEATQTYMYDGKALERMASVVPGARLIAILRNPVDRAYSHYWLNRERQREPLEFREAIEAEPERIANGDLNQRLFYSYLDRGRYARQLSRICELYSREKLHVILFDDLCSSPREAYQSICRFLGIDNAFIPPNLGDVVNPYVSVRSVKVRNITRGLPRRFANAVGRINSRVGSYPPLDPSMRAELLARFESEIKALEEWLGRRIPAWRM